MARVRGDNIESWVKVADFGVDEVPREIAFNDDESYAVIQRYDPFVPDVPTTLVPVRLNDTAVELAPFVIPAEYYVNSMRGATKAPRFLVNTLRVYSEGEAATPILALNLESNTWTELTPRIFASVSPGFTRAARGILTDAYEDETGAYGVQWLDVESATTPAAAQSVGTPSFPYAFGGYLSADGSRFFGLAGEKIAGKIERTGPVALLRSEFSPAPVSVELLRLTEHSRVDRWLFTSDGSAFIYRAMVDRDVYRRADPPKQSEYVSELGAYWANTDGKGPVRLALGWTEADRFFWLPDSAGLLRVSPDGEPLVVSDDYTREGAYGTGKHRLHWLKLNGAQGTVIDLTEYIDADVDPVDDPDFPSAWSATPLP
jgi:hypothetical protein